MTEIELKAHVLDRATLVNSLNAFATHQGSVIKDDTYYATNGTANVRKIRIRRETRKTDSKEAVTYLLTYKRKELRTDELTGTALEVNDEQECEISSPQPFISFLTDSGCTVDLIKHKEVDDWTKPLSPTLLTDAGLAPTPLTATFELCTVPPLGDFLEIEVLSAVNDEKTVSIIRREIESLLEKVGIPKSCIERRYYSEMLKSLQ